jgi:hypothetical protein
VGLIEAVRAANRPGEAEGSLRTRAACAGAVLVAIAAAAAQHEVSAPVALGGALLVAAGMAFSYATRVTPPWWIKVVVALGALAAMFWFFDAVSTRSIGDITTVEDPLTVLFICIQVAHSFHVPARRDLMFSLGASAGLMAVAAAQAIDLRYGVYAALWVGCGWWALLEMWASASGGGQVSKRSVASALTALSAVAVVAFLLLPAPGVAVRISFQSRAGLGGPISTPGALAGDGASPAELSHPGSTSGATRVGGYLGFANTLDTALRGKLADTVVMEVRAERPSYWVGETFDQWDGQSWTATAAPDRTVGGGSPFYLPPAQGEMPGGSSDLQTFYVVDSEPDLVFHADNADEVWFPSESLFVSSDGTVVSPIALGKGAVYTVESYVNAGTPAQLRAAGGETALAPPEERMYTQLPHPYRRVQALADSVTAGLPDTYDKVEALISWMGAHTRYSTDIPPLPSGADTVDEFLFGNRTGFCEQISTSLAVMLRTLGIPVRETVGYVPGSYDPVTDLYEVQAKDAHAWVQVWFPRYGWTSFDPTADVPLANPSPGATALHDVAHALGRVPWLPVGSALCVAAAASAVIWWWRRRPATWAEAVARRIERRGRRAGRPRSDAETILEYARALEGLSEGPAGAWVELATTVELCAYGGHQLPGHAERELLSLARRTRLASKPSRTA